MPGMAYKIAHRRVLVVEEVVEEWQIDQHAKLACDIEELVRETADLLKPVERAVAHLKIDLLDTKGDEPTRLLAMAHLVGCLINKTVALFPKVKCLAEDSRRIGVTVDGLDNLEEAKADLIRLRNEFHDTWRLPDEQTVGKAKQELKSGKYRTL
jgi:hypothetical protein